MNNLVDMMEVHVETFMYKLATYYEVDDNLQATYVIIYTFMVLHRCQDFAENNSQIMIRQNSIITRLRWSR